MWAEEVTFTFNTDAGLEALGISKPSAGAGTELGNTIYTLGGVSMTATTADGKTATRVWNSNGTTDLRIYADGTFTFTASENITSIVLSGGTVNGFNANTGSFSSGTWTGSATSVTLTATGTEKINTITVTTGSTTPVVTIPAPILSPAAGTVESGAKVTISNYNQNYLYYYTTNGTDPAVDDEGMADNGTAFPTDGLAITSTTTLKVIATDGEGNVSDITSATYTVEQTANYEWVETNLAGLTSSDIFVIVGNNGNNYAMSNDKGTSEAPTAVSVTIENGKITSTVSNNIKWSVSGNATDGYIFNPSGSTSTWLYCTNSNNGVRVGINNAKLYKIASNGYLYNVSAGRYLGIYSSQDWRCYTTVSTNIANQTFKFYKRVSENEPTLTAVDVEVEYDAHSGSIAYTLENATGGTLSATTTANWLTIGTIGTTVPFTCTTNPTASERIATVTLSYSLPSGQTLTATATVTQAANPDVTISIAEARAQETGDVQTKGVVTSVYGKTAYIQDATAAIAVRGNDDLTVTVGDEIKVGGTLGVYSGLLQIQSPTITVLSQNNTISPQLMTVAEVNSSTNQGWLVKIEEATVTLIDGQSVTIAEGDNTVVVRFNTTPSGFAVNDKLTLIGNISCFGSTKQIANPTVISVIESAEPLITVDPTSINATYEGEEGNISVTYDNVVTDAIEIVFYTTAEATTTTTCSWIEAIFDEKNNVQYTIAANEGEARTAYMKIYGLDENANDVYSDLITITQGAQPTTEDYALFSGDLVEGDYIIYYDGKAMNTTVTNSRLGYEEVTPLNNIITTDNAAIVWHIAKSGNYWTICNAAEGKYAAATGTKNQATVSETSDDKALWKVSVSNGTYEFVNKYNDANKVNANLRNNNTYGFACYATATGGALSLYKKVEAVTIDEADYVEEAYVPTEEYANVTFKRTLVEGWNGLVLPFDMTVEDAITKFNATAVKDFTGVTYDSENGATLNFSDATEITAGKPFMIKAAAGTEYTFSGVLLKSSALQTISQEAGDAKYTMTGTYQKVDLTNVNFVLIQEDKYYQHNTNKASSAKAFRAYFLNESTGEAASKGVNINFDGEATGIELVENGQFTNDKNGIYNLQGQKVNNAQKGVYIVNGKKIVVK